MRRGTSLRDYLRLKAALDRLQSSSVITSIRQAAGRRLHRFSCISEWKERSNAQGRPVGLELTLPDWLYAGITDISRVLTIDPAYFRIRGGIERWLYRLARKHAGQQAMAGVSIFLTCTASPTALRASPTSRSTCVASPPARPCPVIVSRWRVRSMSNRWCSGPCRLQHRCGTRKA
jgi:plasmid replication initiation protein